MNNNYTHKRLKISLYILSVLATLALVLTACAPTVSNAASSPNTLDVATNPSLGKILVDGMGMTLYIFTKDTPDTSNCNATCLANWTPLASSGTPKLGPGVDASLVSTATLSNGEKIITYNHMPLYTFIKDTQPVQTNGEGVINSWFVISPDGKPVESANIATPAATPAITSPEATINVATSAVLGQYLVDGNGMTLYVFAKDGPNQSNCTGVCLTKWLPLLISGNPTIGTGIVAEGIGSAPLSNGTKIVTYYGMSLYTFSGDTAAGQMNGVGVAGLWFAVARNSLLLQLPTAATPTPAPNLTAPKATPTPVPNMMAPTATP